MVKLIALHTRPRDTVGFDTHDDGVHPPLVKKHPGLRNDVRRFRRRDGRPLAQPEGRAIAKDLMSFVVDLVTVFFGEVESSSRTFSLTTVTG